MGVRARQFCGRPCDWPGCAASADPSVSFAHGSPVSSNSMEGAAVRAIGLDVHRDFCEVAIAEAGHVRSAGRIATRPEVLEAFAQSLASDDRLVLEVTGNAWEIARIIEPHVRRVVVVSPSDTGIRQARAKTDRLDARTLAKLLAGGSLDSVWMPDERTRVMRRRLARRDQLVSARTRAKNEVHAILIRRLKGRPEVSDLFGKAGRAWLGELELARCRSTRPRLAGFAPPRWRTRQPARSARSRKRWRRATTTPTWSSSPLPIEERETLDSALRQIDFLDREV